MAEIAGENETIKEPGPEGAADKPELAKLADALPPTDPEKAALVAGLFYVEEGTPGFRRKRQGRGFTYLDPQGRRISDTQLRERFEALVIPPAWTEVWICPDPNGHIQVTGRDEKGRKQYIYHAEWDQLRNLTKFNRLILFGEALPLIRERVDQDLRARKLSHTKVLALVVSLLESTLIRIGNPEYARQNQSYGLTTMLNEHIDINGSRVTFQFRGKSGKEQEIDLYDRRLARAIQRIQELPGQHLFQFIDENGACCQTISSHDVNDYLRETTGQDFTAKEFRTWGGTVHALIVLSGYGPAENEKAAQKNIVQAVKEVATTLGNTPAVCRKYYIHPAILQAYQDGRLFTAVEQAQEQMAVSPYALDADETAVISLLYENIQEQVE